MDVAIDKIALTMNGTRKSFRPVDGTYFNANDIAEAFQIVPPSQWRNKKSSYYRTTGDFVTVKGRQVENANLHFQNLPQGSWMTETALYAWAADVDVEFGHKMVLCFKNAVNNALWEAAQVAREVSAVEYACHHLDSERGTVRIDDLVSLLLHGGHVRGVVLGDVYEALAEENLIIREYDQWVANPDIPGVFADVGDDNLRIPAMDIDKFVDFIRGPMAISMVD